MVKKQTIKGKAKETCNRIWKKAFTITEHPGKMQSFHYIFIFLVVDVNGSDNASISSCCIFD